MLLALSTRYVFMKVFLSPNVIPCVYWAQNTINWLTLLIKSDTITHPDSAPTPVKVCNSDIPFASHARNRGITNSFNTAMDKHATNIRKSSYAGLQRIGGTRHLPTVNATQSRLCAFVLSKTDYFSSLLSGSPQSILDKLEREQNSEAKWNPACLIMYSRFCAIFTHGLTTRF